MNTGYKDITGRHIQIGDTLHARMWTPDGYIEVMGKAAVVDNKFRWIGTMPKGMENMYPCLAECEIV